MKSKKVKQIRTHIAISAPGLTKTSIDVTVDKVEMEYCPLGVIVRGTFKGKPWELTVFSGNIIQAETDLSDAKA